MPTLRSAITFLLLVLATSLGGCGGGDPEPEPMGPTIELRADQTLRLYLAVDGYGQVLGFSQPLSVTDIELEFRWHSGSVSSELPAAPRATIARLQDGRYFIDLRLNYAIDRGIVAVTRRGFAPWVVYGQPMAHLIPKYWAFPAGVQAVDVYGGRIWLDISFR
jgi:hypothetical protein